jgi:hypothetical protein
MVSITISWSLDLTEISGRWIPAGDHQIKLHRASGRQTRWRRSTNSIHYEGFGVVRREWWASHATLCRWVLRCTNCTDDLLEDIRATMIESRIVCVLVTGFAERSLWGTVITVRAIQTSLMKYGRIYLDSKRFTSSHLCRWLSTSTAATKAYIGSCATG